MMKNQTTAPLNVLIIGGGFAGIRLARKLAGKSVAKITLMSDSENFAYYPQLYHTATGGPRDESSISTTRLVDTNVVDRVIDRAVTMNAAEHSVTGESGRTYHYDKLVMAIGSVTNYFNIPGLKENSLDIKTIDGAENFKWHLHDQLIRDKKPEAHYVIVGGGATGIELSSSLSMYLQRILTMHGVQGPRYQIDLVEAGPRLMPRMAPEHADRITRRLQQLGINIMTNSIVEGATATGLDLKGMSLASKTVVWTAGVSNNPFFMANEDQFSFTKNGRITVGDYLEGATDTYVIGDNAATPFSGLAQTALYDADFVARDIERIYNGSKRAAYKPKQPPSVIPVGNDWAALEWGKMRIYGRIGWQIRRLADLIGYQDLMSLGSAIKIWLQDGKYEDNCPVCGAVKVPGIARRSGAAS